MIPEIRIEDYEYPLDDSRIAKYPLESRDASKLLHYRDGAVNEYRFRDLPSLLPGNSLMVFNDTRVVPARLHFRKATGALIEIFCLEPLEPSEYVSAFAATESSVWKCVIGNAKKWKGEPLASDSGLRAELLERDGRTSRVRFSWEGGMPFSEVLERSGTVPIPPYLNRESEAVDAERYQTLYARWRGSVAAPTAGLHFTEDVLGRIRMKGISIENVCLHVGAGTFLPVKGSRVSEHPMHREPFVIGKELVRKLIAVGEDGVTAVGTTSVRTLESLYYAGVSIIEKGFPEEVGQWVPYERDYPYSTAQALEAIASYLDGEGLESLKLGTRIIIVPGFRFRLVRRMVTNFHQPQSTLILLVSAFVGGDWRTIYDYALDNNFRFLSYGDGSLLERAE